MANKQIPPEVKLQIVLAVLKEERLVSDIASEYGIHPCAVHRWEADLIGSADEVFAPPKQPRQLPATR